MELYANYLVRLCVIVKKREKKRKQKEWQVYLTRVHKHLYYVLFLTELFPNLK